MVADFWFPGVRASPVEPLFTRGGVPEDPGKTQDTTKGKETEGLILPDPGTSIFVERKLVDKRNLPNGR